MESQMPEGSGTSSCLRLCDSLCNQMIVRQKDGKKRESSLAPVWNHFLASLMCNGFEQV